MNIGNIIYKATVLHNGWEMDNSIWVLEYEDGNIILTTTNNGGYRLMTIKELDDKIKETESSLISLKEVKKLINSAIESGSFSETE